MPPTPDPLRPRQKRSQVARACDGCRVQRVKCDHDFPCANCKRKGKPCSNGPEAKTGTGTLSEAQREIQLLREKVQELEDELVLLRPAYGEEDAIGLATPPSRSTPVELSTMTATLGFQQEEGIEERGAYISKKDRTFEGVMISPTRSPNPTWFGPSSLYYFVKLLDDAHGFALHLPAHPGVDRLQLGSPAHGELLGTSNGHEQISQVVQEGSRQEGSGQEGKATGNSAPAEAKYLNSAHEGYFIDLFWQSFHASVLPIIDEAEFKKHHQSLWNTPGGSRRPSALVDIILALCMQLGVAALPSDQRAIFGDSADPAIAGRWHFRRCRALLALEQESPSLSTLQCHLLCCIYLCGGTFHNMVDSTCGQAVRTAYMLGVHVEKPKGSSRADREKSRRLFWATYLMDAKIGMKLGRPFLLGDSPLAPQLPSDDFEASILSGSSFTPIDDTSTWLTFNKHHIRLYMAARTCHAALFDKQKYSSASPDALEASAEHLGRHSRALDEWPEHVPKSLRVHRQETGVALSTDGSDLVIDQFAPLWLQRQRLLLELAYHNLSTSIYRPFITFTAQPWPRGRAEHCAEKCVAHGVAFTKMVHQILTRTTILNGWHEVFHWQWNVAITLVGYSLAYPQSGIYDQVRGALELAVVVFDAFGVSFGVAASAAAVMRTLCSSIDNLKGQGGVENSISASMGALDGTVAESSLLDFAIGVDFWADMESLWPGFEAVPDASFFTHAGNDCTAL